MRQHSVAGLLAATLFGLTPIQSMASDRLQVAKDQGVNFLVPYDSLVSKNRKYAMLVDERGTVRVVIRNQGLSKSKLLKKWGKTTRRLNTFALEADGLLMIDYGIKNGHSDHIILNGNRSPHTPARLVMQNDGNLVVYDAKGKALWASNTVQRQRSPGLPNAGVPVPQKKKKKSNWSKTPKPMPTLPITPPKHEKVDWCDAYANEALKAAAKADALNCGYTGPRWSQSYKAHYRFCSKDKAPAAILTLEHVARDGDLKKCRKLRRARKRHRQWDEDRSDDNFGTANGGFIFPRSHKRRLTERDLISLSQKELWVARNEIFARKGYIFSGARGQNYFENKDWYEPVSLSVTLSPIEKANVRLIRSME